MTFEAGYLFREEIVITPTPNKAIIVKIGCKTFATKDIDEVLGILDLYMKDPEGSKRRLNEALLPQPDTMAGESAGNMVTDRLRRGY